MIHPATIGLTSASNAASPDTAMEVAMPDSSDNVNARDGASIVWGPEIRVDGKRPEGMGLRSFDKIDITSTRGNKWYSEGASGLGVAVANVFWPSVEKIRLPADHPHYGKAPTTPELDPALWDRMVRAIHAYAGGYETIITSGKSIHAELLSLAADLPKPVDPDLLLAREMAKRMAASVDHAWSREPHITRYDRGEFDDNERSGVPLALAAIKRGRELAGEQA